MTTPQQYPSGNASLFSIAARKPMKPKEEVEPIWFHCTTCMDRVYQTFRYDDGIYEVYACEHGHENRKALR